MFKTLLPAPQIFCYQIVAVLSLHAKICISLHVPSRTHLMTRGFTRHSRTMGPQQGTFHLSEAYNLKADPRFWTPNLGYIRLNYQGTCGGVDAVPHGLMCVRDTKINLILQEL